MSKYLEAEKQLAELLGWAVVEYQSAYQRLIGRPPKQIERTSVPRWTCDWSACGPLMVEHGCYPLLHPAYPNATKMLYGHTDHDFCIVYHKDHPDKETAVRFAIVMAVISKLEQEKKHATD